jgi:hypothetical protein
MAYKITYLVKLYSIFHALWSTLTKLGSILFQPLEKKLEEAKVQNTYKY